MKLPKELLEKIYFLSDSHFQHQNICRGVSRWDMSRKDAEGNILGVRDFDTLEEMNETLISNINNTVPEDALLFHLGDFSFGGKQNIELFRNQINCRTIHLIRGNHDTHVKSGEFAHCFTSTQDYLELQVGKLNFVLFHFPIASWNGVNKGWFHLHGHQHWVGEQKFGDGKMMDVGVDGNNLFPYWLPDVVELLKDRRKVDPNDHHTRIEVYVNHLR